MSKHYHCPHGCENPQPIVMMTCTLRICGRCYFIHDRFTIMFLCTPEVCHD